MFLACSGDFIALPEAPLRRVENKLEAIQVARLDYVLPPLLPDLESAGRALIGKLVERHAG